MTDPIPVHDLLWREYREHLDSTPRSIGYTEWLIEKVASLAASLRAQIASKDARIAALEAERDAWPIWLAEALAFGIDIQPVEPMPSALFDGLVKAWAAIDLTCSEDDWRDLLSAEGVVGATSQPEERTP